MKRIIDYDEELLHLRQIIEYYEEHLELVWKRRIRPQAVIEKKEEAFKKSVAFRKGKQNKPKVAN